MLAEKTSHNIETRSVNEEVKLTSFLTVLLDEAVAVHLARAANTALGGSLDPEPDSQSPFFDEDAPSSVPVDGRPGVRVIRRSGV